MTMKKMFCAALAAVLLLSAACGSKTAPPTDGTPPPAATPTPDGLSPAPDDSPGSPPTASPPPTEFDYDAAYSAFAPGTIMLTAGGTDVNWSSLYSFLFAAINEVASTTGELPDWTLPEDEGLSYKEYILTRTLDSLMTYAAIEYGAAQSGVTLTEEDFAEIAFERANTVQNFGNEAEFAAALKQNGLTEETYAYRAMCDYLAQKSITALYGEKYEKVTDEQAAQYASDGDYLMAKHILIPTTNEDDDGNSTPMTPEEKLAAKSLADELYGKLATYDGDDFALYFDTLMYENSSDYSGLALNPDGYLFTANDMPPEFESATRALTPGALGEPVESDFGYHIILRLPIDYDATPLRYTRYEGYTIRALIAREEYGEKLESWKASMTVTYAPAYDDFDIAKVFAAK